MFKYLVVNSRWAREISPSLFAVPTEWTEGPRNYTTSSQQSQEKNLKKIKKFLKIPEIIFKKTIDKYSKRWYNNYRKKER